MTGLAKALEKESVAVAIRRNEQGRVYGLTYIDHQRKSVFNGSDLGKAYSAKGMLGRLNLSSHQELSNEKKLVYQQGQKRQASIPVLSKASMSKEPAKHSILSENIQHNKLLKELGKIMEQVIQPEDSYDQLAYDLLKEQKRKRKRQQGRQQQL